MGIKEYSFLVGGEWRKSQEKYELKSPYDGQVVATINRATAKDVEDAIARAAQAFEITRDQPGYKKAEILLTIVNGLKERKEELSRFLTLESGKPIVDARAEVDRAMTTFTVAAEEAKRIGGEVIPLDIAKAGEGRLGITRRFPLGVITAITPFNFPINLVAHKVAPAIASGNTLLLRDRK